MKRILLFMWIIVLSISASAQGYWQDNYPWDQSGYTEWSTVADKFQVAPSASSITANGLIDLTAFSKKSDLFNNWTVTWGNRYQLNTSGDELHVTFNPEGDLSSGWSSFNVNFAQFAFGKNPNGTDLTGTEKDGFLVNMTPTNFGIQNGKITFEVFVPSSYSGIYSEGFFPIRASLIDIHGHEFNAGGDAIDTINISNFDVWTQFSLDYNDFLKGYGYAEINPGDGWSETFCGVSRPISKQDGARAPIDFSKIAGISFYLCPGTTYLDNSLNGGIIKIRNMVVGDATNSVSVATVNATDINGNYVYWDNACYPEWDLIATDYMVSYSSNSTYFCKGLSGISDFQTQPDIDNYWKVYWGERYSYTTSGNELLLNVNESIYNSEWSSIQARFFDFENDIYPNPNDKLKDYSINGYSIDMRNNKTVGGKIFIPSSFVAGTGNPSVSLSISVMDAHGHTLNSIFPETEISTFDSWTDFLIDYDQLDLLSCPGDAWSSEFHGVINPIYDPNKTGQIIVPIDWKHIVGIFIAIDNGHIQANSGEIKFKDLVLGLPSSSVPFIPGAVPPGLAFLDVPSSDTTLIFVSDGTYSIEGLYSTNINDIQLSISSLTDDFIFSVTPTELTITNNNICNEYGQAEITISSVSQNISKTVLVTIPNYNELSLTTFDEIPAQVSSGAIGFQALDLKNYINDVCPSNYTASAAFNSYISLSISNELVATATVGDNSWMGSAFITISLSDNGTVVHEFVVEYVQNYPVNDNFSTPPTVTINPSKLIVSQGETVTFNPTLKRATEVEWTFTGANIPNYFELFPTITYAEAGDYVVTLIASNALKSTTEIVTIKVVGILGGKTETCLNEVLTLTANLDNANYLWSTGETTQTIEVSPTEPKDYSVTVSKDNVSYEDVVSVSFVQSPYPEELKLATVSSDNKSILLAWERSASKGTSDYKILREGSKSNVYDTIATVPFNEISVYVDESADFMKRTYKYALVTVDVCGNRSPMTSVHKTVHLQIVKDIYGNASLQWNMYQPEDIYESVGVYKVENSSEVLLEEIAGTQVSYTDENYQEGNVYRVGVLLKEPISPSELKSETGPYSQSLSNISESELTSVNETQINCDLEVFPNPNKGEFNYVVIIDDETSYSVSLSTATGAVIYSKSFEKIGKIIEKISNLEAGVYYLTISTANGAKTKKVIVE